MNWRGRRRRKGEGWGVCLQTCDKVEDGLDGLSVDVRDDASALERLVLTGEISQLGVSKESRRRGEVKESRRRGE
eukprot:273909-Hanusia_phi.AAC.1